MRYIKSKHFVKSKFSEESSLDTFSGNFETDDADAPAGETKQVNKDIYGVKQNGGNFFNNKGKRIFEEKNKSL